MKLTREKDPSLFKEVEKEHKSGNLEKMRKEYDASVKKEITQKNLEYKNEKDISPQKGTYSKTPDKNVNDELAPYKTPQKKVVKNPYSDDNRETKKVNTPVNKSPVEKNPGYESPTKRASSDDNKYDPGTRQDDNDNDENRKEKAPTSTTPDAKSKSVSKNPYAKPDNDRKTPTPDAEKRSGQNTKR
jgi:hypothetical protein